MAKPIVDGLERDLEGRAQVIRLNVLDGVGSAAAQRYAVRGVPTMLVFDGQGKVVSTSVGLPDRKRIVQLVSKLAAS